MSQTFGPYRILDRLAKGGMGVVYRAQREGAREPVALKTVLVPHERHLQGIRREIQALAGVQHPGVVRVREHGVEGGVPWYAMDLVEGVSLRRYASRFGVFDVRDDDSDHDATQLRGAMAAGPAEPHPLEEARRKERPPAAGGELPTLLELVLRICGPLAFLHGEGIVHRDLKPSNILIRPDGSPVLVDFGVFSRFSATDSREALVVEGRVAGTAAFMSPEQVQGQLVDARSDLYALGCILYELLTGWHPFVGTKAMVLFKHVHEEPEPPSALVEGVPAELDALVLGLLAKRPEDRFGYADDVAHALGSVLATWWPAHPVAPPEGPPGRPYLYRPRFAGRGSTLTALLDRARGQRGGVVLVGGESGVGKTRLLLEVAGAMAGGQAAQVVGGHCPPEARPLEPFRHLLQLVADRCRERGSAETARLMGDRAQVLAAYEPSLLGLPGQDTSGRLPMLPPHAARQRVFRALARTLAAVAENAPLLLVLDDLQWADELSLGFLEALARSRLLEQTPLLVLGSYRTEEAEPLARLLSSVGEDHLELGRLDEAATGAMVADMLALPEPPPALVAFLARHTEGNPFFVGEYLRAAVEAGLLWREVSGNWQVGEAGTLTEAACEALELPRNVKAVVRQRLQKLSLDALEVTSAAAVVGREVDLALVVEVTGLDDRALLEALGELVRRQVFEEDDGGRLRFAHDKLREVAVERLSAGALRRLHRAAAEAMEAIFRPFPDERLAEVARHWELGGESMRASERYLAAARHAVACYAHHDAERHFQALFALHDAPTPDLVEARCQYAHHVLDHLGRVDEAYAVQEQAEREARQLGSVRLEARAALGIGRLHYLHSRPAEAVEAFERSLALARKGGYTSDAGKALNNLGLIYRDEGRFSKARAMFAQDMAICREQGDHIGEAITLRNMALVVQDEGDLAGAEDLVDQAIAILATTGHRLHQATAGAHRAELHMEQGRVEQARALWDHSLVILREIRDRLYEASSARGLGMLERRCGRLDVAEALQSRAEALLEEYYPVSLAAVNCEIGHLRLARGLMARPLLEEARRALDAIQPGTRSEAWKALSRLERAVAAFEVGSPLLHGECPEDVPEPLRRLAGAR